MTRKGKKKPVDRLRYVLPGLALGRVTMMRSIFRLHEVHGQDFKDYLRVMSEPVINGYLEVGGGIGCRGGSYDGHRFYVIVWGPPVCDGGGPPELIAAYSREDFNIPEEVLPARIREVFQKYADRADALDAQHGLLDS